MSSLTKHAPGTKVFLILAFAGLFTSGCRSYGGDGAEEATYRQMQVAHQVFEEELVRARADLDRLLSAASGDGVLNLLAAQYGEVVQGHEAILEQHANWIAELSADSDYRPLHRTFGAIISQQRTIRIQYEGVLDHVQRIAGPQDTTQQAQRPYSLIPPYYYRVTGQQRDLSINRVLSEVRSGAAASGVRTMAPGDDADVREGDASSDAGASSGSVEADADGGSGDLDPDAEGQ